MVLGKALPDAQDVGEQAQGHPGVFGALVFEEQIEKSFALLECDVEEQIAFGTGELRIDEGAGFKRKRIPVEGGGEFWGKMVFKEGACVFRGGKGCF